MLRNGSNLHEGAVDFIKHSTSLQIFAPYVKHAALSALLRETRTCQILVVRWDLVDLIRGVSDLEVFELCRALDIVLYRNPRLHLKAFVDSGQRCLMGSANISGRALNVPVRDDFNYELATVIDYLDVEDRLYFSQIVNESVLITDELFRCIKSEVEAKKIVAQPDPEFSFAIEETHSNFLISSLPMTFDVPTLLAVLSSGVAADEQELNCAVHDAALYHLRFRVSEREVYSSLKANFFSHPFIHAFVENLMVDGFIYFGAAKEWIQKTCTNVPTPRKWELTGNIQILYRWFVELGEGMFVVDVPGARSERLRVLSWP